MVKIRDGAFSVRKSLVYVVFGIGSLFFGLIVLPLEKLCIRSDGAFRKAGRRTIAYACKLTIGLCSFFRVLKIEGDIPDFSGTGGKILAPNHPSLLDIVILLSLIPEANCIVRGGLLHSAVGSIVKALYTVNDGDIEELKRACADSLARDETLIIFPEGTRTKKNQPVSIKRGAACIAIFANAPIIPLYIGGGDKTGLRKKDPFWKMNADGGYSYTFTTGAEIQPSAFEGKNARGQSFKMTAHLESLYRKNVT